MRQILDYFFADRSTFIIFENTEYDGDFSVYHRGRYLYINPPQFGGAGLSWDRASCASHTVKAHAYDLIRRWFELYHGRPTSLKDLIIIERFVH